MNARAPDASRKDEKSILKQTLGQKLDLRSAMQAAFPAAVAAALMPAASALAAKPPAAKPLTKTASGLEYYDVKVGQGDGPAKIGQTVTIDYIGWLNDFEGKEFARYEKPVTLKLGEKNQLGEATGLKECLLADMNIGGTRRCKLPAKLAFGATGYPTSGEKAGSLIPPNADVYFQVRLRSIAALSKVLI
jgi:FKBP-type peptidyl-prolyl cis-trans isomerase